MHLFFSGIGGAGIGPLALVAHQAGYDVSGSDKQDSLYIDYLKKHGVGRIHIGQDKQQIQSLHETQPIDWLIYSSALPLENPHAPELEFAKLNNIKTSKRDELLNLILKEKQLSLVAVAGTHGKTTTSAMLVWLFKRLGLPVSFSVGAKMSFAEMGQYDKGSRYFIYEADEFDRNFLSFEPHLSLITGVGYDHHEIFPTLEDYKGAFKDFISQSDLTLIWQDDYDYLGLSSPANLTVLDPAAKLINLIQLKGQFNRLDAWLALQAVHRLTDTPVGKLMPLINKFPGLQRRMEEIVPGLYSDYAHTPEKIRGCLSVATEIAAAKNQAVVVVYEPLTNRRQHYIKDDYKDAFSGASKLYWLPSYLAREDPDQAVLTPEELIPHLSDPAIAEPAKRNQELKHKIEAHLKNGDLVVGMAGGGGGSLDEWLRAEFAPKAD